MIPGSGVRGSPRGGGCGGRGVAGRARAVRGAGPALAGPTPPRLALRGHSASERRAASTPCATTLPHAARETTPAHATAPVMLPNSAVMCRRSVPERVLYLFPKRWLCTLEDSVDFACPLTLDALKFRVSERGERSCARGRFDRIIFEIRTPRSGRPR